MTIPWRIYDVGASKTAAAVVVNFKSGNAPVVLLDQIRSVYIDNLNNNVPVYVYFPDTDFTVPCKPNATAWMPVIADQQAAVIIGQGFTDNDRDAVTKVMFTNVMLPPYVDDELPQSVSLYRASPEIQRGNTIYNSRFAPPALGDQTRQALVNIAPAGNLTAMILPAQLSGVYIVTNILLTGSAITSSITVQLGQAFIESTGPSGILYQTFFVGASGTVLFDEFLNIQPAQIKLNATEEWRLRSGTVMVGGILELVFNFTYLPNE